MEIDSDGKLNFTMYVYSKAATREKHEFWKIFFIFITIDWSSIAAIFDKEIEIEKATIPVKPISYSWSHNQYNYETKFFP